MSKKSKWLLGLIVAGIYVGCAPAKFSQNLDCEGYTTCIALSGNRDITLITQMPSGVVDVLFVDDNSGSMSTEQNQIANRFSSFISTLDAKQVDYRIGIITTDTSDSSGNGPSAPNGYGALQNGNLVQFADGSYYLSASTGAATNTSLFAQAIKRNETLNCETWLKNNSGVNQQSPAYAANCPSGDERGIYTANQFIAGNPYGFIRPNANLAIVFLSDEDVRSSLYYQTNWNSNFLLKPEDLPQTLINRVSQLYRGKSVSLHAITIRAGSLIGGISPQEAAERIASSFSVGGSGNAANSPVNLFGAGDTSCLNAQNKQINNVSGSYGYLYTLGARMTGGIEGNICASDYGSQLSGIANNIQRNEIALGCADPRIERVTEWDPTTESEGNAIPYVLDGQVLKFDSSYSPQTWVFIKFICSGLQD